MRGARRRRTLAGLAVLLLLGGGAAVAGATAAGAAPRGTAGAATGQVYVVHGILGTTLSVDVDGRRIADAAAPKTVLGPLTLPAGRHVVALRSGTRTVTSATFEVQAGRSIDVVAHRAADAAQTARVVVFRNDLSPVGRGRTRLVVAHAAVAPPVDVRVDGSVLFRDVASGEALSLLVPARTYTVDVVPVTGSDTILRPVRLTLKAGTLTRVFAVGNPSSGTADAVVQVLPVGVGGSGVPASVPTGDGGQAADEIVGPGSAPRRTLLGTLAGGLVVLALLARALPGRPGAASSRHAR
jgi:hypothetical protein